jgi:carboxymethylenebutenolidase
MSIPLAPDRAIPVDESTVSFESGGRPVTVEQFAPRRGGKFPAVLILHGSDGLQYRGFSYQAFGRDLARRGYVALLVHYFDRTGTQTASWDLGPIAFVAWMQAVGEAVTFAGTRPAVNAGRLGLAGFSLGAYLALGVASQDTRVGAVVELFGGLPDFFAGQLMAMPPVLILHGDADRLVPVSEAHKLERVLTQNGRPFEIRIYPGVGHGFYGADADDALRRALDFFDRHLKAGGGRG